MKENRFEGEVTNVEYQEDGWYRMHITSPYSGEAYEVKISEVVLDLINYNLEKCKETKPDEKLLSTPANIYLSGEDSSKLEIVFTEPMLYSICFVCRSIRKI